MIVNLKMNDEEGRILALERYDILDAPEEASFENVMNLVQMVLKVPMCAISLVDRNRLCFKAQRGLGVDEVPRRNTLCDIAISQTTPLAVEDVFTDLRFADCALSLAQPRVRSYLGIPLRSPEGYNIGTLCVMDTVPRLFAETDYAVLNNFAKVIMNDLELRQAASKDHLTGTLSRRAWIEKSELEVERAARYKRPISLAVLDIDRFKYVNDTFGHPAGDRVIKYIAALCKKMIRKSDYCGRLGGEEFAIMMPETGLADAYTVTERIRASFEKALIDVGAANPLSCTISVGVTERARHELELAPFVRRADEALYQAKNDGRNRVEAA